MTYIHELKAWPCFEWDPTRLALLLAKIHQQQGHLLGRMEALGFNLRAEAALRTLTLDVIKNSEIENEILDRDQVRSSIARQLGLDIAGLIPSDRNVEGAVEITLDALQDFDQPLTKERLFDWHAALFPLGRSGMRRIVVGAWRDDSQGPMQVVSGPYAHERVHYEAPSAERIDAEMKIFLEWFNEKQPIDPIIKAGIAHLWFITLHPFEDGNGRLARTIADLQLARADGNTQRFYSLSAQIRKDRTSYYKILEKTQKDSLDINEWLEWFLFCLDRALNSTKDSLEGVLNRAHFWETESTSHFNPRQRLMLNKLLDDFRGKLTTSKWATITKCSQDTATRDIQDLIQRDILVKEAAGGRSTSYILKKKL